MEILVRADKAPPDGPLTLFHDPRYEHLTLVRRERRHRVREWHLHWMNSPSAPQKFVLFFRFLFILCGNSCDNFIAVPTNR